MHILLLAATAFEIQPVIDYLQAQGGKITTHTVTIVIAGVGSLQTTYGLMKAVQQQRPDLIIQAGIGGSFSPVYPPGTVVLIEKEITGDLGVEEEQTFKDVFDMGFLDANAFPYASKWLVNPQAASWTMNDLPLVKGITVNEVTTRPERINQLQKKYQPVVESMEGAAMHLVALQENIPFVQLRAVSNIVGERNKTNWKIKEAIGALNEAVIKIINTMA